MRTPAITLLTLGIPFLASCGSSWDIRKGEKLFIGCAESYFYADADEDGWGDPTSEPMKLCEADVAAGLTASNGRDCDDGDDAITGYVGTSCPDGLVGTADGVPAPHGGIVFDQSEFAYVYGADAPVVRHGSAIGACEGWGGAVKDGDSLDRLGHLATFQTQAELNAVREALDARLDSGSGVFAAFIGLTWDGASVDAGSWVWEEGAENAVAPDFDSWCDGVEPSPADFFPNLNPNDPDHVPSINAQLDELRLAWVRREGGTWCVGLPWQAIPADIWADLQDGTANLSDPLVAEVSRYTTSEAHLLCERPQPDPADYRHLAGADDEE